MDYSTYLIGAAGLIIGFSCLIFVHELGHHLLAKWNGVRVQVFSLGMGPYLLSFTWHGTLYALSLIPVGGYVKMAGQDDLHPGLAASTDPGDYRAKRPGQRAAILAAGAFFNLLFAFVTFGVCYRAGVEMFAPCVGEVAADSPLAQAEAYGPDGKLYPTPLREGDRITVINGEPVKSLLEVTLAVAAVGADREVSIHYERDGVAARQPVFVHTRRDVSLGAATIGMREPHMAEERFRTGFEREEAVYAGVVVPNSAAQAAGLRTGDRIVSVDGQAVQRREQVYAFFRAGAGREQKVVIERNGEQQELRVQGVWNEKEKRYLVGLVPIYRVGRVDPGSEAYQAGLRPGCFLVGLGKLRGNKMLEVSYVTDLRPRPAHEQTIRIPRETAAPCPLTLVMAFPDLAEIRCATWGQAFGLAWSDLWRFSTTVFVILKGLVTRDVSPSAMSGPLGIADVTTRVAVQGSLMYYLWFLALLSLNLGVLQFVPIPILDGFHLLLIGIEKLKGSPVPVKVQEVCQYVGIVIIVALLLLVTKNDLVRIFF